MKILVLFTFLTVTGVMSQSAVTYSASIVPNHASSYKYAYTINDPSTGDIKNHQEVHHGTVDDHHGYNANVQHEGHGVAVVPHEPVAPSNVHSSYVVSTYAHPYAYHAYPYAASPYHTYPYAYHAYPYASYGYTYPSAYSSIPVKEYCLRCHFAQCNKENLKALCPHHTIGQDPKPSST